MVQKSDDDGGAHRPRSGPKFRRRRLIDQRLVDQRLVATSRRRRRRNFGPPLGLWAPPSSSKFWTTYLVPDPSRRRRLQPPPMSFEEISVVVVERAAPHSQISPAMMKYRDVYLAYTTLKIMKTKKEFNGGVYPSVYQNKKKRTHAGPWQSLRHRARQRDAVLSCVKRDMCPKIEMHTCPA